MKATFQNKKSQSFEVTIPRNFVEDCENEGINPAIAIETFMRDALYFSKQIIDDILKEYQNHPNSLGLKYENGRIYFFDPFRVLEDKFPALFFYR